MNKFLKAIGWKTPTNRWDKIEIKTDVYLIGGTTVLIGGMIWLSEYI